jgi:hypothetical protein
VLLAPILGLRFDPKYNEITLRMICEFSCVAALLLLCCGGVLSSNLRFSRLHERLFQLKLGLR